jgi:hypothetical protein
MHFIPDFLTYSVPLCLKRQCDRTLGNLVAWIFPGSKQDAVVAALRAKAGVKLDLDASLDQAPDETAPDETTPMTNAQYHAAAAAACAASPRAEGSVTVSAYKKAIAVSGDTRPIKDLLKEHGGRWNGKLRARSHWRFIPPLTRFIPDFANVFGASMPEATMRPNPRQPRCLDIPGLETGRGGRSTAGERGEAGSGRVAL